MTTLNKIYQATSSYADVINSISISKLLNEIMEKEYDIDNVYIYEYIGWLPFGKNTRSIKFKKMNIYQTDILLRNKIAPNLNYRYNIGILSISYGYDESLTEQEVKELVPHYLSFILDNELKQVWLFDSIGSDSVNSETGFKNMIKSLYRDYEIMGMNVCSGCKEYEPLFDEEFVEQNIFCHTWTLYFLHNVLNGINLGESMEKIVDKLNSNCKTRKQNLITIKKYSKNISKKYLKYKIKKTFSYIYVPAYDVYEMLSSGSV